MQTFYTVKPTSCSPIENFKLIAFTAQVNEDFDIFTYDTRNVAVNRLTYGIGTRDSILYWSHNGSKIAFVGKDNIIYIVDLASKFISKIDQVDSLTFISWNVDNQRIAYGKGNVIIIYNVQTHTWSLINENSPSDVNWFSNGRELLFADNNAQGISQVYKTNINGTTKTQITNNTNGPLHDIRLSPDNTFFANTTPGASISIIQLTELSTNNTYEVAGGPLAKNYNPTWSPDSSKLAFSATIYDNGYSSQVRTVGRHAENESILAISSCFASPVTWSPNSRWIAYLSGCKNEEISDEMWAVDIYHHTPIRLLKGYKISNLSWSPVR